MAKKGFWQNIAVGYKEKQKRLRMEAEVELVETARRNRRFCPICRNELVPVQDGSHYCELCGERFFI